MEQSTGSNDSPSRVGRWLAATLLLAAALLVLRLSSYGIWDPWELSVADTARRLLEGSTESLNRAPLGPWLIARGFGWIAIREWAGRLPIALSGLLSIALLWAWARKLAEARVALYAALIATTSLMVVMNSRQMLGDAPALVAGALISLGAAGALFEQRETPVLYRRWLYVACTAVGVGLGVLAQGALLAALPALLAAVTTAGLMGRLSFSAPPEVRNPGWALAALAAGLSALVGYDIWADTASYSAWVGGMPQGDAPPTYERTLEMVFHGFSPWSALVPLAVGGCLSLDDERGEMRTDAPLRLIALLWAGFAYAAHSLFQSRFGAAAYPGTLALAAMVALWLRDVETSRRGYWAAGLVAAFFVGLVIRDFALYPASPMDALSVRDAEVPAVFNPKRIWAALLGGFAVSVVIAAAARPLTDKLRLGAPYRWLRQQWGAGLGMRVWLGLAGLLCAGLLAFGALAWIAPRALGLTSLAVRVGRVLLLVPLAIPLAIAAGQSAWFAACKLERYRLWPAWIMAVLVAGYTAFGFLPSLSSHFSPRDVFNAYNLHAGADEPLAEYQVGSRAAAYYAAGDIQELKTPRAMVEYLLGDGRRWATFPSDKLAEIDGDFRKRSHRHLFLASDPDARVVLVANQPVADLEDSNPLSGVVLTEAPTPEHPLAITFDDKIELLGYNLKLPGDGYVGPGQQFEVEWVFRALRSNVGNYQIFVHVDGAGNRLNGDHDAVDDKYPVRLWEKGDVVVDRQTLSVPANYRTGRYEMLLGFFRGNTRLKVTSGPDDGADRAKAGHLTIR